MKIYTRTGDAGDTSLLGGTRVRKNDPRIEAYGTIDELNAVVGLARAAWAVSPIDDELHRIQEDLFEIGALLATPADSPRYSGVADSRVAALEKAIDRMEETLAPLTSFILPGGSESAASLHLARTVCRRAERLVIGLESHERLGTTMTYLNRLSDFFFVAARLANASHGIADVPWTR